MEIVAETLVLHGQLQLQPLDGLQVHLQAMRLTSLKPSHSKRFDALSYHLTYTVTAGCSHLNVRLHADETAQMRIVYFFEVLASLQTV